MLMMIDEGDDDDDWWPWHLGGHSPPSLCLVSPRSWHCHGNRRFLSSPSLHGYRPALIHKRCRGNAARLIDGISALPQQRGWEVGLLAIDFSTPSNLRISHSPIHLHTHDHVILTYPLTPSSNSSFCSSCVLCKRTVCAHKHNFPAHTHTGQTSASASFTTETDSHTEEGLMTVTDAAQHR